MIKKGNNKNKVTSIFTNKIFILDILLVFLTIIYYSQFLQKGLTLMDEGYILHMSERISSGQIPFRNFLSQYSPGYLYLIAFFFKIFGPSILLSRLISMSFCIGIITCLFIILNQLKISNKTVHLLTFLSIISFGFPLLNFAIISWPIVFFSLCLVILLIKYFQKPSLLNYLLIGTVLSLIIFFKQNFGLYYSILVFIFILFNKNKLNKVYEISLVIIPFALITITWTFISFFNNYEALSEFISFSTNFGTNFRFSYPPLTMLKEPLGFFKLLPYYTPIFFLIAVIYFKVKNSIDRNIYLLSIFSLIGFFGLIYPGSDLLHLYPFYGVVLVSLLVFLNSKHIHKLAYLFIIINVSIGFYLTFYREYLRYSPPYSLQNTPLMIVKASSISTTKDQVAAIRHAYDFIKSNTSENEPIFVYPTSPMLYFLLDRNNPSRDSLYITPYSMLSEDNVLNEIKKENVRYIVTDGRYEYPNILSEFIIKQKKVFSYKHINIFLIEKNKSSEK